MCQVQAKAGGKIHVGFKANKSQGLYEHYWGAFKKSKPSQHYYNYFERCLWEKMELSLPQYLRMQFTLPLITHGLGLNAASLINLRSKYTARNIVHIWFVIIIFTTCCYWAEITSQRDSEWSNQMFPSLLFLLFFVRIGTKGISSNETPCFQQITSWGKYDCLGNKPIVCLSVVWFNDVQGACRRSKLRVCSGVMEKCFEYGVRASPQTISHSRLARAC